MKAFVINRCKDPLRKADVPEPALRDRDVLVQVKAASANQL
jgi:NADPH:quinone reductase-like Zn-dependent oxidoreductase